MSSFGNSRGISLSFNSNGRGSALIPVEFGAAVGVARKRIESEIS